MSLLNLCYLQHFYISFRNSHETLSKLDAEELKEDELETEHRANTNGDQLPSMVQINQLEEEIYQCAPGEDKVPKYMLMDKEFEALAFPDCFPYGNYTYTKHTRAVHLSWRQYFQQRLLNIDSRFAKNMEYLFCAQHITDIKQLQSDQNIALRKTKSTTYGGQKLTAGMLCDTTFLGELVRKEHAYKFMKNIRGSPAYWQGQLYEVMAMLRQLGKPTFFLTLSAADLHWIEMITAIGYQIGHHYSRSDILEMPIKTRNELLKQNPITAVRIFDHRLNAFFQNVILHHPSLKVLDYVIKIEFQARGSPHAHCILWVENAPHIDIDSDHDVIKFIDAYITAVKPIDIPHNQHIIKELETKQQHSFHSDYCRRNHTCRFGFPKAPSEHTTIARAPADDDCESTEKIANAMEIISTVRCKLSEYENVPSLCELLEKAGIPRDIYAEALKIAKTGTKIILRRNPADMHTNACNLDLLHMWNANMDFQYIVDEYSTIMYICSYMMKSEKEMGELLKRVGKETQNKTVQEQMNKIGKEFINKRVVGAPEAAMRILSLPLIKKSRKVVFVNGNESHNRVALPKSQEVLQLMDNDDDDVLTSSIHDKYSRRPSDLHSMCLAMFAVSYDTSTRPDDPNIELDMDTDVNGDTDTDIPTTNRIKLSNGKIMYKRKRLAILRVKRFKHETQPQEYYYSRLLLFYPWRNETHFCESPLTFGEQYKQYQTIIDKNATFFHQDSDVFDDVMANENNINPETAWDAIAPLAASLEADAEQSGYEGVEKNTDYNMDDDINILDSGDINTDLDGQTFDISDRSQPKKTHLNKLYAREAKKGNLTNKDYYAAIYNLTDEQRNIVMWNRMWCKHVIAGKRKGITYPGYKVFLSGPGGTGKSHIISLLQRDIVHFFKPIIIPDIDQPLVLLTAPTGIAAFQIDGSTIHSAFNLSCGNEDQTNYANLTTMQTKLQHLLLSITDEISMVSKTLFQKMNLVLTKIKGASGNNWANTSILAVGDLFQLKPVSQLPVYKPVQHPKKLADFAPLDWYNFQFYELTQIMRQKDDQEFANKLNSIRQTIPLHGSDEDKYFKSCEIQYDTTSTSYPIDAIHLYPTNIQCSEWNNFKLESIQSEAYTSVACDSKKDSHAGLSSVTLPDNPNKTRNLRQVLVLKVGTYVMLNTNLDVTDGLTNGARGIVTAILPTNHLKHIQTVLVKFKSDKIGTHAISLSAHKSKYPDSVPIKRLTATFEVKGSTTFRASRTQFPLSLSWAMTIHKCQGLTLPEVVVCMKGRFQPGQAYVAFSRVTSKSGLHILDYDISQIQVSTDAINEMKRLKNNHVPQHCMDLFPLVATGTESIGIDNNYVKLLHLNVPNVLQHSHHMHLATHVQDATIISLNETMLSPLTNVKSVELGMSPDMQLFRRDRNINGGGVLLAVHKDLQPVHCILPILEIEIVIVQIHTPSTLYIVSTYRPSWQLVSQYLKNLQTVLNSLDNHPICIVGDFNEDIFLTTNQPIYKFFSDCSYKQHVLYPTRDSGTLIDHIYTKDIATICSNVSDCYFSDHDFVCAVFSTKRDTQILSVPTTHMNSINCLFCLHPLCTLTTTKSVVNTGIHGEQCIDNNLPMYHEQSSQKPKQNSPTKKLHKNISSLKRSHTKENNVKCKKSKPNVRKQHTRKHSTTKPQVKTNILIEGNVQFFLQMCANIAIINVVDSYQLMPIKFIPLSENSRIQICQDHNMTISNNVLEHKNINHLCIQQPTEITNVKGDGNCFFRAIAFLITGNEEDHTDVRYSITQYISSGVLDTFLGMTGDIYLDSTNMKYDGIWGTDIEIHAAAQLFQHDVFVYHIWGNTGHKWLRFKSHTGLNSQEAIYLENMTSNHFNPVLSL